MGNIVRGWKRVMAVGCSHGPFLDPQIKKQVLDFRDRWKPSILFHLGDVVDTAAFRSGAKGTADESSPVGADLQAGINFLTELEPTHITWGNHDWRLWDLADHPNAVIAHAASVCRDRLTDCAARLHAKTVPYDIHDGWFHLGGVYWGHGYWYNEHALRDHAEYHGGSCVIAHLHRAQALHGRVRAKSSSYCVGLLADPRKLTYARKRRATSAWSHGVVFGEICENQSVLWLAEAHPGEKMRFPL